MEEKDIIKALKAIMDPHTGQDIIAEGFIKDLKVDGDDVTFVMEPPPGEDHCPQYVPLAVEVKRTMMRMPGVGKVKATFICHMQERAVNQALEMMDETEG